MMKKIQNLLITVLLVILLLPLIFLCQCTRNQSIKNIETFARLYGYVRFFHPSDEASKINWTHFTIYSIKKVEKAKNNQALKQILEELFLPIAPSLVIYHTYEKKTFSPASIVPEDTTRMQVISWQHRGVKLSDSPEIFNSIRINRKSNTVKGPARLFDQRPMIGEHINKELGMGLSCIVPLALYGTPEHTYPTPPAQAFENLESAIKKDVVPDKFSGNDRYVRLADVVIAWNVFQHFYPYFDVVKVNWDNVLTDTLQKAQTDGNEKDFLLTLREMVAKLDDCQANVYHPIVKTQAGLPFKVVWLDNRVVITFSRDKRFKPGDIILSIDGVNAEKALLKAEKYISGSFQWKRNRSLALFGFGDEGTAARLKIKRDGKTLELNVVRNFKGQVREFIRKSIKELKNNIYYVDLDQVKLGELEVVIDRLVGARGVIFDVRGYVAFEKWDILGYLVDRPIRTFTWHFPEVIYPDRERVHYTDHYGELLPKVPGIKGKVVFLVHGYTISAAEVFIGMVERYKLGEIVGQRTAGTGGNINPFRLPGGYLVFWTGLRVLRHDRLQHHLVGIMPTVLVERTFRGIKQGRDEFLEKAIEVIEKKQTNDKEPH
ncbi:MAG: hypothetical protein JSV88_09695 [Candidatus Aminicenantes bacterium]|nr:MAG: hypothetical protein JSV88_09695 [Candidatus Aminicenantes bacterium]